MMKCSWKSRNVDLSLLCDYINRFFVEKNFTVHTRRVKNVCEIMVITKHPDLTGRVIVQVSGSPNQFLVDFVPSFPSDKIVLISGILNLFGAGYLTKKALASQDKLKKLEREFWHYVDSCVLELTNSA